MVLVYQFAVTAIIADPPGAYERHIEAIKDYGGKAIGFIGHTISAHPNEFITALATCVVAWFTFVLARSTTRLWKGTKEAAAAQARDMQASIRVAEQSATIARQALVASNRAWIKIIDVGIANLPLTFSKRGIQAAVSVKITNFGNAPAIDVSVHVWLVVNGAATMEKDRLCASINERDWPKPHSWMVLPGETFPPEGQRMGFPVHAAREEVEARALTAGGRRYISPDIVGCIDYRSPSDPSVRHQTHFVRHLRKRNRDPRNLFVYIDETVFAADLELVDAYHGRGDTLF